MDVGYNAQSNEIMNTIALLADVCGLRILFCSVSTGARHSCERTQNDSGMPYHDLDTPGTTCEGTGLWMYWASSFPMGPCRESILRWGVLKRMAAFRLGLWAMEIAIRLLGSTQGPQHVV